MAILLTNQKFASAMLMNAASINEVDNTSFYVYNREREREKETNT